MFTDGRREGVKEYKVIRYRDFLTEARERSGMSQGMIAKALGISRSCWQKYEYGDRRPGMTIRVAVQQLLGVPLEAWEKDERCA